MVMRWLVPLVALDLMPGVSETLECDASGWLDAEGMNRMYASGETSIVRFDRPPCAVCAELDPLFEIMRTHFPGRVWRVDCAAAPGLCAPVDGDLRGPEIRAWTGELFAMRTASPSCRDASSQRDTDTGSGNWGANPDLVRV